jgi:hypothetical protein
VNLGPQKPKETDELTTPTQDTISHSQNAIGSHTYISQNRLESLFNELDGLPDSERLVVKSPSSIATEVLQILSAAKQTPKAPELKAAFPSAFALLDQIIVSWDMSETVVECVSSRYMINSKHDICAVSRKLGTGLKIFIGMEQGAGWTTNFRINSHTYVTISCIANI